MEGGGGHRPGESSDFRIPACKIDFRHFIKAELKGCNTFVQQIVASITVFKQFAIAAIH